MGVINVWDVVKDSAEGPPIWRSTLRDELKDHRMRINEIVYGKGHLWSGKDPGARPPRPVQLMTLLILSPQPLWMRQFGCMYIRHLRTQSRSQVHPSHMGRRSEPSYPYTSTPNWIRTHFRIFWPDLGIAFEPTMSLRSMK
jgi:hypothetical protein